ncbi:class III lanthionine synthetase LanKC [Saccharothrix longispora]
MFYDSPDRWGNPGESWPQGVEPPPDGWTKAHRDSWTQLVPDGVDLPHQGWKIHVSSTLDEAPRVLRTVWDYCVPRRISFKFLDSARTLLFRNLKYADRSGSGKFVTVYPQHEDELHLALLDLDELLAGVPGPRILSDLRWRNGPVHVRYGGFARRLCRVPTGELVPAIAEPGGKLVPDVRGTVFRPPDWVKIPEFLVPHVAALGDGDRPADFFYEVERALHFSNGGGVYVARDLRVDRQVVLKEARPHAGLDRTGADAVRRLHREHAFLVELADVPAVADAYELLVLDEHHFLAQEYVQGARLNRLMVQRHPLIGADPAQSDVAEYTRWALDVLDQVADVLDRLHRRGIVFADLHPNNVVVEPDGRVRLIDFEMAYREGERPNVGVGAPGYVPTDHRTGPAADHYALGCLRLAMFYPITQVLPLDPGKAGELAAAVADRFPVGAGFTDLVAREIGPLPEVAGSVALRAADLRGGGSDWAGALGSAARAILSTATPHRDDRLFPGDLYQFSRNGLGFGHGAAGVLHALAITGHGRHPEHEQWLVRAVGAGGSDRHVGLHDGLCGIAYALDHLGLTDEASQVLDRTTSLDPTELSDDLFAGLAGVGLTHLHFADRLDTLPLVRKIGAVLVDRLAAREPVTLGTLGTRSSSVGRGGLLRGDSGPALLLIRLFEHTGEQQWLDAAATCLAHDLASCVRVTKDDSVQLSEGWRSLPYLASGSAGVGAVLHLYLGHSPDERLTDVLTGIRRAASIEFAVQPGLFNGRAGLVGFLGLLRDPDAPDADLEAAITTHLRSTPLHFIDLRGEVAFPGEQLMRLSMDLGSGGAGVLTALHAVLNGGELLPFLPHVPPPPARI